MNSEELLSVFQQKLGSRIQFIGILSANQVGEFNIPVIRSKDIAFIANILPTHNYSLGHWVCYLITESPEQTIIFFDSYALHPTNYSYYFKQFLQRYSHFNQYHFNKRLQSNTSIVCGLYCAYFIFKISRFRIESVARHIIRDFSARHYQKNDKFIFFFYSKYFTKKSCSYWLSIDPSEQTYEHCRKKK